MATFILRWFSSRAVRRATDLCRQVRRLIGAQLDLLSREQMEAVTKASDELRHAIRAGESTDAILSRMKTVERIANENLRPHPSATIRENVEVLLVTGAVVLALRTFFFQPMAIPSGSAQPTLWGVRIEPLSADAGIPGEFKRWGMMCWSGIRYFHLVAKNTGVLRIERPRRILPFVRYQRIWVGDRPYTLWFPPDDWEKTAADRVGEMIRTGDDIVKMKVTSGDHLFVDRITYNFRRPHRGEIIVFYSNHLPDLIQETHYIKRLIAFGGEHVRIGDDRHVYINGEKLDASSPRFENIYSFDPDEPPETDRYSGHVNGSVGKQHTYDRGTRMWRDMAPRFPDDNTEYVVHPRHYLAFGDNTMNSHDGRAWGDFPEELLVGKANFVFWPVSSRFGWGYR